jgi:dihydroxyacetone kinase
MGKNVDGSAAGTANSIEPLEMKEKQALATVCVNVVRGGGMDHEVMYLRLD